MDVLFEEDNWQIVKPSDNMRYPSDALRYPYYSRHYCNVGGFTPWRDWDVRTCNYCKVAVPDSIQTLLWILIWGS